MMKICNFSYHIYGSRVKSAFGPSGPSGWSLSRFLSMKQLRVFLLPPPPGWDASPSQGYPPALSLPYPFIHLGRERHCESKVWLTQEHNSTQSPWPGLEPGPLALESSALTMRPPHLPPYFMTRPKFQYPIYDHSVATVSVPTHNFRKSNFF